MLFLWQRKIQKDEENIFFSSEGPFLYYSFNFYDIFYNMVWVAQDTCEGTSVVFVFVNWWHVDISIKYYDS